MPDLDIVPGLAAMLGFRHVVTESPQDGGERDAGDGIVFCEEHVHRSAPGRIRTSDQQLRRLLLYPPELRAPEQLTRFCDPECLPYVRQTYVGPSSTSCARANTRPRRCGAAPCRDGHRPAAPAHPPNALAPSPPCTVAAPWTEPCWLPGVPSRCGSLDKAKALEEHLPRGGPMEHELGIETLGGVE